MSDTIIASIITFFGTVSAPLIVIFFQGYSRSSKIASFKKEYRFKGEWKLDTSSNVITDEIIVNGIWFGRIKCTGTLHHKGAPKSYKLIGSQYGWCITFEYLGTENGQHDETAGVVIFEKTTPNNIKRKMGTADTRRKTNRRRSCIYQNLIRIQIRRCKNK